MSVKASITQIRFKSVLQAFQEADISYDENNPSAVLIWHDSLKEVDYFKPMNPWQVVNRIPNMFLLSKKALFARIIQYMKKIFPEEYSFIPKTYILPYQNKKFIKALSKENKKFIIKPDGGSLGQGIYIIKSGTEFTSDDNLSVAQVYIESHFLNNFKYDLRIYVLLASINPLEIYVYRDGVARFCSDTINENSIFSQITNVALNKENPDMEEMSNISKLISDIIPLLNIDNNTFWSKIDKVVIYTILSVHKYLLQAENKQCPPIIYSRCFQILGFDILLDNYLNPFVLEVNYRPSLDYYQARERRMKVGMIRDALRIVVPLNKIQSVILARKWSWDIDNWKSFLSQSPELLSSIKIGKENAEKLGRFVKVYPSKGEQQQKYDLILNETLKLPNPILPGI